MSIDKEILEKLNIIESKLEILLDSLKELKPQLPDHIVIYQDYVSITEKSTVVLTHTYLPNKDKSISNLMLFDKSPLTALIMSLKMAIDNLSMFSNEKIIELRIDENFNNIFRTYTDLIGHHSKLNKNNKLYKQENTQEKLSLLLKYLKSFNIDLQIKHCDNSEFFMRKLRKEIKNYVNSYRKSSST